MMPTKTAVATSHPRAHHHPERGFSSQDLNDDVCST
jgi:hypothetical protein